MSQLLPIIAPRVSTMHGDWLLCIRADPAVGGQLASVAGPVLSQWMGVARKGGFLASEVLEQDAGFVGKALQPDVDAQAVLAFRASALDVRAFQIVRSAVLSQAAQQLLAAADGGRLDDDVLASQLTLMIGDARLVLLPREPFNGLFMTLPGADPDIDDAEVSEVDLYPAPRPVSSFAPTWAQQQGTLRRCIVSFARLVDRALLAQLTQHIAPWAALLELGGFEQPTRFPGKCMASFGTVQIFEENSAEIVVDSFEAAEGAWFILVNLLAHFALLHPVVAVDIH